MSRERLEELRRQHFTVFCVSRDCVGPGSNRKRPEVLLNPAGGGSLVAGVRSVFCQECGADRSKGRGDPGGDAGQRAAAVGAVAAATPETLRAAGSGGPGCASAVYCH